MKFANLTEYASFFNSGWERQLITPEISGSQTIAMGKPSVNIDDPDDLAYLDLPVWTVKYITITTDSDGCQNIKTIIKYKQIWNDVADQLKSTIANQNE